MVGIDNLISEARERGFANLDAIRTLGRESLVCPLPPANGHGTSQGASRVGGLPVLPASVPWPRHAQSGASLAFVAQVDCTTLPDVPGESLLPRDGLLLFFYDANQSTWGFNPSDAGSFSVVHVPHPPAMSPMTDWPADVPNHARYASCGMVFERAMTLPPWESVVIEDLGLDREQADIYNDLLDVVTSDQSWASRAILDGYPDQIQGDMSLECALVAAGLNCGDASSYMDPRLPVFRQQARDWRLLLQVPSVETLGIMWGDAGCLYYWIREEDLRARRFDRSWMIFQCH